LGSCNILGAFSSGGGGGGGSGTFEFLEAFTLDASASTWTINLATPYVFADYDRLVITLESKKLVGSANADLEFEFNGITTGYFATINSHRKTTSTLAYNSETSEIKVLESLDGFGIDVDNTFNALITMRDNPFEQASDIKKRPIDCYTTNPDQDMYQVTAAHLEDASPFITQVESIKFGLTTGNLSINSIIRLYRVAIT